MKSFHQKQCRREAADWMMDMDLFDTAQQETGLIPGFLLGTVLGNSDSKQKGTLKIRLTCEGAAKNILDGVKVLAPVAGAAYGVYALPEIGDQVVVGFLGGSLARPFVLGSLYTASDKMLSESFEEANLLKRMKTKGGTLVEFIDKSGKESVLIKTPKGLSVKLEDERERITLTASDTTAVLDGKGGNLSLKAKNGVTLEAGGAKLTFSGGSVTLKGTGITLDGSTLTMKGQKSVLSGSMVEVKADGVLVLKGSMTKIN